MPEPTVSDREYTPVTDTLGRKVVTGQTSVPGATPVQLLTDPTVIKQGLNIRVRCASAFLWSGSQTGVFITQPANYWLELPVVSATQNIWVKSAGGAITLDWFVITR
jgi:hypothetical protein